MKKAAGITSRARISMLVNGDQRWQPFLFAQIFWQTALLKTEFVYFTEDPETGPLWPAAQRYFSPDAENAAGGMRVFLSSSGMSRELIFEGGSGEAVAR